MSAGDASPRHIPAPRHSANWPSIHPYYCRGRQLVKLWVGWWKRRPERSALRRERGGAGGCEANARRASRRGGDAPSRRSGHPPAASTRGPRPLVESVVVRGVGRWTVRPRWTKGLMPASAARHHTRCTCPHDNHDAVLCRLHARIRPATSDTRWDRENGRTERANSRCSRRHAGREPRRERCPRARSLTFPHAWQGP
jgi:hypothetical protein